MRAKRHPRESGGLGQARPQPIPAFAGMTGVKTQDSPGPLATGPHGAKGADSVRARAQSKLPPQLACTFGVGYSVVMDWVKDLPNEFWVVLGSTLAGLFTLLAVFIQNFYNKDTHFTEREFLIKRDIYLSAIDNMSKKIHIIEKILDLEKDLLEENDHAGAAVYGKLKLVAGKNLLIAISNLESLHAEFIINIFQKRKRLKFLVSLDDPKSEELSREFSEIIIYIFNASIKYITELMDLQKFVLIEMRKEIMLENDNETLMALDRTTHEMKLMVLNYTGEVIKGFFNTPFQEPKSDESI
jgi:hypothetical protein